MIKFLELLSQSGERASCTSWGFSFRHDQVQLFSAIMFTNSPVGLLSMAFCREYLESLAPNCQMSVIQNTFFRFSEICNSIPCDMLHHVFDKRLTSIYYTRQLGQTISQRKLNLPRHQAVSRGGKVHLLLPFLPTLSHPLEKYKLPQGHWANI